MMASILYTLVFALSALVAVRAQVQCGTFQPPIDANLTVPTQHLVAILESADHKGANSWQWIEVPFVAWNYSDINNPNALGFRDGFIYYQDDPAFCLSVPNAQNRRVEVMAEAEDSNARICVHDLMPRKQASDVPLVQHCGNNGKLISCFNGHQTADPNAADVPMILQFYCDEGCPDNKPMRIRYRVRVSLVKWTDSQTDAETNLDMWCMMMSQRLAVQNAMTSADYYNAVINSETKVTGDPSDVAANFVPQAYPSDLAPAMAAKVVMTAGLDDGHEGAPAGTVGGSEFYLFSSATKSNAHNAFITIAFTALFAIVMTFTSSRM